MLEQTSRHNELYISKVLEGKLPELAFVLFQPSTCGNLLQSDVKVPKMMYHYIGH